MKAIIIVDCQNDFSSTGSLPVKGGTELAIKINKFIKSLDSNQYKLIFSRDWHPKHHISFKEWPIHCVRNTHGANYIMPLDALNKDLEVLKGTRKNADSYSAFYKNKNVSKLAKYLQSNSIKQIYVCGLVKDVCVLQTANDAIKFDYETYIIDDLTIALDEHRYREQIDHKVRSIKSSLINK